VQQAHSLPVRPPVVRRVCPAERLRYKERLRKQRQKDTGA